MLSLVGFALGLFSSAKPKALDMWQDRAAKAHELAVMKAQAEVSLDQTAIDAKSGKWKASTSMIVRLKALTGWKTSGRWSDQLWLTVLWVSSFPYGDVVRRL